MIDTQRYNPPSTYDMLSLMRRQPQQDRSHKRVKQILDTTSRLILEVGVERLNAGLIAQHSNIPVGTIYQFFTDVEAICTEIIIRVKKRIDGKIMDELHAYAKKRDYRRAIEEIIDTMISGFRSEPCSITILNALIHTKPYAESTQITIRRLSEYASVVLLQGGFGLEEEKANIVADVIFESGYRVFEKILLERDHERAEKYKKEWSLMLKQYLSVYLEPHAVP